MNTIALLLLASSVASPFQDTPRKWVDPFKILPVPATGGDFAKRLDKNGNALWLEDDVLSFLHRTTAKQVQLTGGIQKPMAQIPGTDLWIIQLEMKGWNSALISYGFVEDGKFPPQLLWRGSKAPAMPVEATLLQGRVIKEDLKSDLLGEARAIYVYLPPKAPKRDIPAVFLADGGACEAFAKVLEPLILAGKVRPCAIIGVANGAYKGAPGEPYDAQKDFRAKEYVPGFDAERFEVHLKFFTEEVLDHVSKKYGISRRRENLAVTGFSNGGAFSAAVAVKRPKVFGTALPMSLGVPPNDEKPSTPMPRLFFAAGSLESFGMRTGDFVEKMKKWGVPSTFDLYVAGHDFNMWKLAFSRLMPKTFPGRPAYDWNN